MTFFRFSVLLAAVSAFTLVFYVGLCLLVPSLKEHFRMMGWGIWLYVGISYIIFLMGKKALESTNKFLFSQISILFVVLKLVFSLTVLVLYKNRFQPADNGYVVPFMLSYFAFTVFETYVMLVLGKQKIKRA
jgi:hypothetical protein